MIHRTQGRVFRQINFVREQFSQAPGLPFSSLLEAGLVQQALDAEGVSFRERIYSPCVTLWVFLSQVLDPISCCVQAVARLLAYRLACGLAPCSLETRAYCEARQRLPEGVWQRLLRATGRQVHEREMPAAWRWKGRPVKCVDGTTVSMPDSPANQKAFPQLKTQPPGAGFPLARLVVIFSLAVGTVLDGVLGPRKGKQTGEISLFRQLNGALDSGDILLGDRVFCSYFDLALLRERQIDAVVRLHPRRPIDFRRGRRLGKDDHLVTWSKPQRLPWLDEVTYQRLPDTLTLREVRVRVTQPGFRSGEIIVVTTLRDPAEVSADDLAELYRARWHSELDLRALKDTLHMDVLRCKSPDMVRKEVWVHFLAYNLIRAVMADAAEKHGVLPRELSFAATLQTLLAFVPYWSQLPPELLAISYVHLLDALARHRVGDRPDRYEPRVKKRRPKWYPFLQIPRAVARRLCLKRSKR